jgi:hypothetical protein
MRPFEIVGLVLGGALMIYNLFLAALRRNPLKQCKENMDNLCRMSDNNSSCIAAHSERITKLEVAYEQMIKIMDGFTDDFKEIKKDIKDLLVMNGNRRIK